MKPFSRTTLRLQVRPFELRDYLSWKNAQLGMPKPKNRWDKKARTAAEVTLARFKKLLAGQKKSRADDVFYDLGIFLRAGTLIGGVSIMEVARGISQTAFLGYGIFNPFWGKGYAKEAVLSAIAIAFDDLKLHRIEAGIEPQNRRSIALAKSLKMRHEGCKKRCLFLGGKWVDLLIYSLTCEDTGRRFKGPAPKIKPRI